MGTLTIDLESLGLTLTRGVTYTIELDEGFVVADGSGIANFENNIVSFTAEGPDPSSTSWSLDTENVTTTWNVKLSSLMAGATDELYFDTGYIDANYFGDYPFATVYKEDSTVVGSYIIQTFTAPNQISFEVPSIDLRADSNYYVYFEADTVKDTVNITNDATTEDTGTVFSTPTEADGFPGFSSSITTTADVSAAVGKIVDASATLDSNAGIVCDSTGLILYDAVLSSTSTITCEATKILGVVELELLSSTATLDVTELRLRNGDSILQTDVDMSCFGWWIPQDTHLFLEIDSLTTGSSGSYREIRLQFNNYGAGTSSVDWGDGTVETIASDSIIHRYYSTGEKHIKVLGTLENLDITSSWDDTRLRFTEVYTGSSLRGIKCRSVNLTYAGDVLGASMDTMTRMFYECVNFDQDLSQWDTSNITDMSHCFELCEGFSKGNLNNWDTSSVTDMDYMFSHTGTDTQISEPGANGIQLEINNWDVSNVTRMAGMFKGFEARTTLFDLSSWNTGSVENMAEMFRDFRIFVLNEDYVSLTTGTLDIDDWDTSNVETMTDMFRDSQINSYIGSWDTNTVRYMSGMFNGNSIFDQDISSWCVRFITSKPTDFDQGTSPNWTTAEKPQWGDPC